SYLFSSWYLAPLVWFCLACGDNPNLIVSQRASDNKQAALHHPKKYQAVLPVVFAVVYESTANGSSKASRACAKLTPCLARLASPFASSHSKSPSVIDTDYP